MGIDVGKRGLVFFVYAMALYLMVLGLYIFGKARPEMTAWIFVALVLWPVYTAPVFARLNMVLPAAAVDRPISFSKAWALTHRMSWRVLGVALLCGLPLAIIVQILQIAYVPMVVAGSLAPAVLMDAIIFILIFAQVAVVAAGLSLTYLWIRRRDAARQAR